MEVQPRSRTRPVQPVSPPPRRRLPVVLEAQKIMGTPMGWEVAGGPRRPADMPEDCVWPQGYFVTTPGKPISVWPYVANSHMVGIVWHEYRNAKLIASHIWRLQDKVWRYAGKAVGREDARDKLLKLHAQTQTAPVAVAPRQRKRPGT